MPTANSESLFPIDRMTGTRFKYYLTVVGNQ